MSEVGILGSVYLTAGGVRNSRSREQARGRPEVGPEAGGNRPEVGTEAGGNRPEVGPEAGGNRPEAGIFDALGQLEPCTVRWASNSCF